MGTTVAGIRGDTRSLDYRSYVFVLAVESSGLSFFCYVLPAIY